MPSEQLYLTAGQAAESLGVSSATLYAYVSRGQLHSEPLPGRPRESRYLREDIDRLRERKESRRDPSKAAERGLHHGSPVLSSNITLIQNGRFYYRGHDAITLARNATLEELAALLWNAETSELDNHFRQPCILTPRQLAHIRACTKDPLATIQMALPLAGALDPAPYDVRPASIHRTGARILRLLTTIVVGRDSHAPVHRLLQRAWMPGNATAADAIRTALVLCADHELNVSAFTARCAASAGASLYDTISAATAAVKGRRHGGETQHIAALFDETGTPRRARSVVANRLRRGDRLPGFGHPLYPAGDPRAVLLMRLAESGENHAERKLARAIAAAVQDLHQDFPNVDFALVALARAYNLPARAPLILFTLGRTVGWIAHAIEQYAMGQLIRPRAKYTGPPPPPTASEF